MQVHISEILKQPGKTMDYIYEGPFDVVQVDIPEDIWVELKLTNAQSRVIVKGRIEAIVSLECARCAETFDHEMITEVEEQFLPENSPELQEDKLSWDNLSLFEYFDDNIDIYEMVRQNILAAIPTKPLCKADCRTVIEENKSESEAGILEEEEKSIDPRLLPLLKIQEKAEKNK
ncbi:MAG: YceD family protein [Vulcanimicrobiota bacterium]